MRKDVIKGYVDQYGSEPEVVAYAPGRLEILGNHTDYNEGVVLSCAVDLGTSFAASVVDGVTCVVKDLRDGSERSFDIDSLTALTKGDWANYIKGTIIEMQGRGITIPAFNAVILSSIPMSAGMSSSAALEISTAYGLGKLAGVELPWVEWAKIGQACENNCVGARTGLLDQFSSIKGAENQLVYSDFRSLAVENIPLPAGTALVVANSMVKHDLTTEYNDRRDSCEDAAAVLARLIPGVKTLRDVSMEQLDTYKDQMDIISYRRAKHVVGEDERVWAGIKRLEAGDVAGFGKLMFESQDSSRINFENSCPELDQLVAIGKSLPGALGARLSGGGFGGISVHLVEEDQAERYARRLAAAYLNLTGKDPQTMICVAGEGARIL
ncbi:MAG: galactokinase [Lentisphaeria bacterium]|nr:galactokinase [Lentisphaeria bacterium]